MDYPQIAMYIDGEWVGAEGRDSQPVLNPATGEQIAVLPHAGQADLERALESARRGFLLWRATPAQERAVVLRRAADWLRARVDDVARIATTEQGKPLAETRIELMAAADCLEWYGEEGRRAYGRVLPRPPGSRTLVVKEPIGPVAAFAPWNFPLGNPARKLGAAIGAGCSVILKPPEEAPASAMMVARALIESGLPVGVMNIVYGVPDTISRYLLRSPVIRKLSFTGSTAVGKHLMNLASERGIRTTMELGGHAPVLVFDDADIEQALSLTVASKYRNAGQVCVSPTRFYIQEGVYERFVAEFSRRASALQVGNGLHEGTRMGPMAHPRRLGAMESLIADARAAGAKLETGGEQIDRAGYFWQPTVLSDVPIHARVMSEEPFGPVAVMSPFKTFDEAIEQANRLPFGLAAYAFSTSAKQVMMVGDALEAGMIGINTTMIGAVDAPFGGVKESGHGSENAIEGLEACLVTKQISQA
ncbi:NAD-dependent succinate-semialdehyde dehydrogenase [Noviherbaspirillum saxi]|uniref:NAD-dependent succinate-semialdehyde dehydrogenase n=1 Tax=Noviherbaspirillum saxi TaxID=2320863 RepID=A0A3A3FID9_9BURK|nr:NAD-dependent succinate-semialdehyde dehydrogenase [Noviherbaspirillum saxi]RJF92294.1 NAD-dependent succinate-semialdehyde dehydrogenase [Noviherbaspirillum saxi]